jgi:hypothetical protein
MPTTYLFSRTFKGTASTDERGGQKIEEVWECETLGDPALTGAHVIAALADQESIYKGQPHPEYAPALCTGVAAGERSEPNLWMSIRVTYYEPAPQPGQPLNPGGGGAGGTGQPTPEDRPPQISGSFRRVEEYGTTDWDGSPRVNSAGDPFDNPPPTYFTIGILNVKRWYAETSYTLLKSYENKVNSDEWQGFPIHSLLISGVEWRPKTERGWLGTEVDFTVEHKELPYLPAPDQTGGWIPTRVLNVGWNYITGGIKRAAREDFGLGLASPILLDDVGDKLGEGLDPTFSDFRDYETISFAFLG